MEIATPLGPDVLLFHRMRAHEELSRLSHYQVSLLSLRHIDLDELLGKPVSVTLALPEDAARDLREFNGYVTEVAQHGTYGRYKRYTATVSPWLWFLTRTSDCRVFQDKTVREIVEMVFADHPADFQWQLTGEYRKRPYCVQYRETDFNFVSRLLEHEGIYYYFTNANGKNTMVLTDSASGHGVFPGYARLAFVDKGRLGRSQIEHVNAWTIARQVQPGAYAHRDYDFERPQVELLTRATSPRPHAWSEYERFDYPGDYVQRQDGERYASVRIDEYASRFETASGATNAKGVAVGHLLNLVGHPREDQNREYLVTAATYQLAFSDYEAMPDQRGATYRCRFAAMPAAQQFRPRRLTRKPTVQGAQTAIVAGRAGDEICTDAHGRVKVQFHWDRHGARNENSSCWVRVSQFWAGHGFGAMFIPRVNQEVIVDFLEGDPDQPIIVGRVYNGLEKPPYSLPGQQTRSGVKTRSTPDGTVTTCNEIYFDDKKDQEQFFMQAERAMTIRVKGSEHHSVGGARTVAVDGNQTTTIKGDDLLEVVEGHYGIEVRQKGMTVVVPDAEFEVQAKDVNHFARREFHANVDRSTLRMRPAGIEADVLGNVVRIDPTSVSIEALVSISLTCGASKIELRPEGIKISAAAPIDVHGVPIKLNC
jgi:type VI secretion system secreted protein VgrG